jgi:hydroxypyruvate isomerase
MPKFAANLTFLFNEVPLLDRFALARGAGFKGVEYMAPYGETEADLATRLKDNGLKQVLFNLTSGDWAGGERGIAILPGRQEEFRRGVHRAIEYASALSCGQINCLAGLVPHGADRKALRTTFVENLAFAAAELKKAGVKLLIEAINTRDIPGFYLNHTAEAASIIDEVGSDNLYIQYDIYHMQITEGDLTRTIDANLKRIAHIQLADNPGRNEPGTGEINYPFLFQHIDKSAYAGWIGCEYKPLTTTTAGLGWMSPYLAAQ